MQKNQKKVMHQYCENGVKEEKMVGQRDKAMDKTEFIGTLGRVRDPKSIWENGLEIAQV